MYKVELALDPAPYFPKSKSLQSKFPRVTPLHSTPIHTLSLHREINTTLIRLFNRRWSIPMHLDHTVARSAARVTQVRWHGNREVLLAFLRRARSQSVLVPLLEVRGENGVGGGRDDGDVGGAGVRGADGEVEVEGLAGRVGLDAVGVIGEFHALCSRNVGIVSRGGSRGVGTDLALPEVALLGVVVGLGGD